MASRRNSIGRHLTAGPVRLTTEEFSRSFRRRCVVLALLLALGGAVGLYLAFSHFSHLSFASEPDSQLEQLQGELEGMRLSLERALLDLDIAGVTQSELERQLAVLTEQHKQVREELEFYKAAGGQPKGK